MRFSIPDCTLLIVVMRSVCLRAFIPRILRPKIGSVKFRMHAKKNQAQFSVTDMYDISNISTKKLQF